MGFYALNQSEFYKVIISETIEQPQLIIKKQPEPEKNNEQDEQFEKIKIDLIHFIEKEEPYKNPKLSLSELANALDIPSYTLSKVLNDGFNKSFFDFINYYRVESFKENINNPKFSNYTLLSIAYEVGFNSKTAFNRAFKKITNQTPSEFYQSRKIL